MDPLEEASHRPICKRSLKDRLLKKSGHESGPHYDMDNILEARVDAFMVDVVDKLPEGTDQNKLPYYFEIYKEGLEARKVQQHMGTFVFISKESMEDILWILSGKDLYELCEMGTSYLTNSYALISSWYRDQLIINRLNTVYSSSDPMDWILRSETDTLVMDQNVNTVPEIKDVLARIGLIINRRY